jgi:hypothetical protein
MVFTAHHPMGVTAMESSKALIGKVHDMNQNAEKCIALLQHAFFRHNSKALDECEARIKELRKNEKALTTELLEGVKVDAKLSPYITVPGHLGRIAGSIESITRSLRIKIGEGILFSERAVTEVSFLLKRTEDVLKNTGDIILARNIIIREYLKDSADEISSKANEYATMHEERLVAGVCVPKGSPLFLEILDAIKGLIWHAREIAVAVANTGGIKPLKGSDT